jgi:glycosyltransferase involved in cell wall biosynthesis/predicted O-methyltransferase YrrM
MVINKKSFPLITIGVPVYNGAATLAAALESLLVQNYPNIQIIISDNASTDDTLTICEEFARRDSRVRLIRKNFNEGAVANFRTVLDAAEGEYFLWAAADDCWYPEFVSRLLPLLENDPRVGVAMCAIERRHPEGVLFDLLRFTGSNDPSRLGHFRLFLKFFTNVKYSLFIYGLFRSALLKQSMNSFPEVLGGDRQFMSHLALACRFAYVDEVLHVRTYQKKHEIDYWAEMARAGILRRQVASFTKLIWCSPIIPWWRKTMLLPVLPKFLLFNFRQTPIGRKAKYFKKAISDKMNIKRTFHLTKRAALALALYSILLLLGGSTLFALNFSLADTGAILNILFLMLYPCLILIMRRWIIQIQKTILQTSVYCDKLSKSQDALTNEFRRIDDQLTQSQHQIISEFRHINNQFSEPPHHLIKELRYLADILLHPELDITPVKGNKLSSHIIQRVEKHRKVVDFVRNLEESRIREVYIEELFPGIQNVSVPIGVINEQTGHANKTDMLYVSAVAKHIHAAKIFEFGTYMGRTALYLARNNPQGQVFTLNLPPEQDPRYADFMGVLFKGQEEEKRIARLHTDSREFDTLPYLQQFDFVFVDGDHSYELVKNDTQKAFELLKPEGIIMWHDYAPKSGGLVQFFREFTQDRPLFRIRSTCLLVYIDGVDVMNHQLSPLPHSLELELREENPYLVESLYHS